MNTQIISDPNILGGDPVIRGTRVSIDRIKFLLLQDFSITAIKNMYPHVSKKTFKIVISEVFTNTVNTSKDGKASA